MGLTWLADAEPETFWAHHAWTDFAALPQKEYAVVVLPVHGFARHGASLLRQAIAQVKARFTVRVLRPLRFVPAETIGGFFGLDPGTAHDLAGEIAAGVKAAGFHKLVFFNTSPDNEPFVGAAAMDARARLGLRTYVIHARSLGLDVGRDHAGSVATMAARLAGLLTEIRGHLAPPLAPPATVPPASPASQSAVFPVCRSHYLPALSSSHWADPRAKDRPLVIVPTAAIEQHGPHLPVGVDAILGQALLTAALSRLPPDLPVLVAPPITYGTSVEHRGFPGTISISSRTLRRLSLAIAGQLRDLGLRRVAFLNTHGGNSLVLASLIHEMQSTLGLDANVLRHGYEPDLRPQEAAGGVHAGEWETALMLACAPELVRMDKVVSEYPAGVGYPGELRPENAAATFAWMTRDLSRSGVIGDPTRATEENGKRWLLNAAEALATRIRGLTGK